MTDALINDKPQFVRLFTENGLNILDYLTYGRLESLYRSVADGTVLYQLLQRHLVERLGTAAYTPAPSNLQDSASKVAAENIQSCPAKEISLFEVGFSDERDTRAPGLVVLKHNQKQCEKNFTHTLLFVYYSFSFFSSGCKSPGTVNG